MNYEDLYQLALSQGLSPQDAHIAAAVALGESGGNPAAQGDAGLQNSKWGPSVGLWQIRSLRADYGTGRPRDASRLTDPAFNAWAMSQIRNTERGWNHWTVYANGTYKQHLHSEGGFSLAAVGSPQALPGSYAGSSLDAQIQYFREQARLMFPWMGPLMDQDPSLTPRRYFEPYMNYASQLLEVPAETIQFTEPKWRRLLEVQEGENRRPASLWEMERLIKTNPEYGYDYTKNARTDAARFATTVAEMFGRIG